MRIRYDGPRESIGVAGFGDHPRGQIREYPEAVGRELLASGRQKFSCPEAASRKEDVRAAARDIKPNAAAELAAAAKMALDAGEVTADGRPRLDAMRELLHRPVTAAERDEAMVSLQKAEP